MNECGAIPKRSAKKVTKFEAMLRRIVASGPIYRAAASTKTDRACTRRILFLIVICVTFSNIIRHVVVTDNSKDVVPKTSPNQEP